MLLKVLYKKKITEKYKYYYFTVYTIPLIFNKKIALIFCLYNHQVQLFEIILLYFQNVYLIFLN